MPFIGGGICGTSHILPLDMQAEWTSLRILENYLGKMDAVWSTTPKRTSAVGWLDHTWIIRAHSPYYWSD